MVVCNTLPETNELESPKVGGAASGCIGATGAAAAGGASGIDVAGTGAAGAGEGSAGPVSLDEPVVLVIDAADVPGLGYAHHLNTASIKIIKAINHCAPST